MTVERICRCNLCHEVVNENQAVPVSTIVPDPRSRAQLTLAIGWGDTNDFVCKSCLVCLDAGIKTKSIVV